MSRRLLLAFFMLCALILILGPRPASSQGTPTPTTFELILVRDENRLTFYLPGNLRFSLRGVSLEVTAPDGKVRTYPLDRYSAFAGLPFDALPAPICLRLLRDGVRAGYPEDCLQGVPSNNRHTHRVGDADVFWWDADAAQGVLLTLLRDGLPIEGGLCPAEQARCALLIPIPPTPTPTATRPREQAVPRAPATNTPSGTASAPVVSNVSDIIGIVAIDYGTNLRLRASPSSSAPSIVLIPRLETVKVFGRDSSSEWLQVEYKSMTGWVMRKYIALKRGEISVKVSELPVTYPD